jgi:hypothetical protein
MLKAYSRAQNEAPEPAVQSAGFVPAIDEGLLSLTLVAGYYRLASDPAQMAHDLGLGQRAANAEDIVRAARRIGLKTIVPLDAPIEIEALIQNKDIGFVEAGQTAVVKVESFPFTRYGTVEGAVVKVSRDAVDDREASALSDPKSGAKPQSPVPDLARSQNLVFPATIALNKTAITVDGKAPPFRGYRPNLEVRLRRTA